MKKLFIISLPILLMACNSKPVGNPDGTGSFGAAITAEGAQPVAKLDSLIGTNKEIANVKLEGKITDVCKKAGCWLSVEKDGKNMMVFCGSESYKVPKNSVGKTAVFEGRAFHDTLTPDMLRHLAMDGGMSEADAKAKYTQPEPTMSVDAKGIIIK